MKMIIVTLPDDDERAVTTALIANNLGVTRIASTGGFLRSGMSTLLIGVEDAQVEETIQIIQGHCTPSIEPGLKHVSLFVLNVEHYDRL